MRKHLLTCVIVLLATTFSFAQDTLCAGQSHTLQATNPLNLTGPSYSLNPGGNTSSSGQFVFTHTSTATYTLYTTGKIPNTTKDTTTTLVIEVFVHPQPLTAVTVTNMSCVNDTNAWNLNLTWDPSNATPPSYTVSWLPDATTIPVIPPGWGNNDVAQRDSAIAAGSYSAVITTDGGCADTAYFSLDPAPPRANFSLTPTNYELTCLVKSINVSASSSVALTYTFFSSSTVPQVTNAIVVTNTNLVTFSVTAEHPVSKCINTVTFAVTQNTVAPVSTLSHTNQNINCASTATTVTVTAVSPTVNFVHTITSPPPNLTWVANSAVGVYPPGPPGTYTYVLLNTETGCSTTKHFTLQSSDKYPTFGIKSTPANFTVGCASTSTTTIEYVNPQSTFTAGGGVSYTIIPHGSTGTLPPGNLGTQSAYTFSVAGTYTAVVRDMANFCESRIPFSITTNTVPPLLDSLRVPAQILDCNTQSVVLEPFSSTQNISYSWSFPSTAGISTQNTKSYTVNVRPFQAPETEEIATYTMMITDNGNKCITTATVDMYQNIYKPVAKASPQYTAFTCQITSMVLTNNSSTGISPIPHPRGFYKTLPVASFRWEGPTPMQPLENSTTYTASIPGTYTIYARDMNNGCESTGTLTIPENREVPLVNLNNSDAPVPIDCGADTTRLSPKYDNIRGVETYSWYAPPPQQLVQPTNGPTVLARDTGWYVVTVRNTESGCVSRDTMRVVPGSLKADISVAGSNKGYAPFTVEFVNESTSSLGNSSITTVWSFGTDKVRILDSSFVLPKVTYTQPGTYTVVAFATKGLCMDTAYQLIVVDMPSKMVIPNVFTPNGDGVNDLFFLQRSVNLSQITAQIFDRWGNLVYEVSTEKGNIEWDGNTQTGAESPAGTYFYVITGTGTDGTVFDQKGTLTLVR